MARLPGWIRVVDTKADGAGVTMTLALAPRFWLRPSFWLSLIRDRDRAHG